MASLLFWPRLSYYYLYIYLFSCYQCMPSCASQVYFMPSDIQFGFLFIKIPISRQSADSQSPEVRRLTGSRSNPYNQTAAPTDRADRAPLASKTQSLHSAPPVNLQRRPGHTCMGTSGCSSSHSQLTQRCDLTRWEGERRRNWCRIYSLIYLIFYMFQLRKHFFRVRVALEEEIIKAQWEHFGAT